MSTLLTQTLDRLDYLVDKAPTNFENTSGTSEEALEKYSSHMRELTAKATEIQVFTSREAVTKKDLLRTIGLLSKAVWKMEIWTTYETMLRREIRRSESSRSGLIVVENA